MSDALDKLLKIQNILIKSTKDRLYNLQKRYERLSDPSNFVGTEAYIQQKKAAEQKLLDNEVCIYTSNIMPHINFKLDSHKLVNEFLQNIEVLNEMVSNSDKELLNKLKNAANKAVHLGKTEQYFPQDYRDKLADNSDELFAIYRSIKQSAERSQGIDEIIEDDISEAPVAIFIQKM
jgi:hypothetical protein